MPRQRKVQGPDGTEHDAEVLAVQSHGEHWNEYLVDDGTLIRLKPIVTEVLRVEGQYDANGNPVYIVQSTNVLSVDAPDELKRGGGE